MISLNKVIYQKILSSPKKPDSYKLIFNCIDFSSYSVCWEMETLLKCIPTEAVIGSKPQDRGNSLCSLKACPQRILSQGTVFV